MIKLSCNIKYNQYGRFLTIIREVYEQRGLEYVEKYGVITYKVIGNKMIYNSEFSSKQVRKPCTMQRIVNLDTMGVKSKQLHRFQKMDGVVYNN